MINTFELKLAATDVDMDANNTSDANATASGSGSAGVGVSGAGSASASANGGSLMDMEFLEKRRGQCEPFMCTIVSGFELIASLCLHIRLYRQGSLPHFGYCWMVFDRRRTYR